MSNVPALLLTFFFMSSVRCSLSSFVPYHTIQSHTVISGACGLNKPAFGYSRRVLLHFDKVQVNRKGFSSVHSRRMALFDSIDLKSVNIPSIFGTDKLKSTDRLEGSVDENQAEDAQSLDSRFDAECDWEYKSCDTKVSFSNFLVLSEV
jgi:hypothetical protein